MDIFRAAGPADFDALRILFREYDASLDVDLGLQGIEAEIANLPGKYSSPRGALFLAREKDGEGELAGCVGVRPFDRPQACELKRLYVRPKWRGSGVGKALALASIRFASEAGYAEMLLDSLPDMTAAIALYRSLGFKPIPPYWRSPFPGVHYFGRRIDPMLDGNE